MDNDDPNSIRCLHPKYSFACNRITMYNNGDVNPTYEYTDYKAKCRDKANLKNGKLKSVPGQIYEEGTELQFDCMVNIKYLTMFIGNLICVLANVKYVSIFFYSN